MRLTGRIFIVVFFKVFIPCRRNAGFYCSPWRPRSRLFRYRRSMRNHVVAMESHARSQSRLSAAEHPPAQRRHLERPLLHPRFVVRAMENLVLNLQPAKADQVQRREQQVPEHRARHQAAVEARVRGALVRVRERQAREPPARLLAAAPVRAALAQARGRQVREPPARLRAAAPVRAALAQQRGRLVREHPAHRQAEAPVRVGLAQQRERLAPARRARRRAVAVAA